MTVRPTARWLGTPRIELAQCGSTNDEAGRLARAGALHGTVVIARTQTAGRGRNGHTWSSPAGQGLYLSAVIRPPLALADVPPMTLAIGIAICDAARSFGVAAELKWPNDVLVGGKKLAGVLVESHSSGARADAVIVGIGVNLAGPLAPEIADRATSIAQHAIGAVELAALREAFTGALFAHVEHWIDRYTAGGLAEVIPDWQTRMAPNLTVRATIDNLPVSGHVAGLGVDGALLLRDAFGVIHPVRSGDVTITSASPPITSASPPSCSSQA